MAVRKMDLTLPDSRKDVVLRDDPARIGSQKS